MYIAGPNGLSTTKKGTAGKEPQVPGALVAKPAPKPSDRKCPGSVNEIARLTEVSIALFMNRKPLVSVHPLHGIACYTPDWGNNNVQLLR
ncbi:MAG: hypothetical protein MAG794_00304 [Gammaproteobacteria bacterium]|nr:hypothetical protein [Gammaproteobacteria bacterium]